MPLSSQTITPGQGLLLLIKHYQDQPLKCQELKKLYILGANNADRCIALCDALLHEPLLQNYEIAIDETSINNDPTRRYFETHLAYQTLNHRLSLLNYEELKSLYRESHKLISSKIPPEQLETILNVIKGLPIDPTFKRRENYQYSIYIKRIIEGSIFRNFSKNKRNKMLYIERVLYLSLVNGWYKTEMPIDIYHLERFSSSQRGRIYRHKSDLSWMRNQHFGLMKGHMPLALDDMARSMMPFEHIKSADYSTFNPESPTIQACFMQFVHPYSNSISCSFLVLLRLLARLNTEEGGCVFMSSLDKLVLLLQLCISSSLYYSGGHSLYEYISLINAPEVQDYFQFLPGFAEIDLASIFYQNNEDAFDAALESTLTYQAHLMAKKSVHAELISLFSPQEEPSSFASASLG
jgi:hypothetical protein